MILLRGGNGNDYIHTGAGNDYINAGNGDDFITVGSGMNVIQGGNGEDTAILGGSPELYNFSLDDNGDIMISYQNEPENTSVFKNVESFMFLMREADDSISEIVFSADEVMSIINDEAPLPQDTPVDNTPDPVVNPDPTPDPVDNTPDPVVNPDPTPDPVDNTPDPVVNPDPTPDPVDNTPDPVVETPKPTTTVSGDDNVVDTDIGDKANTTGDDNVGNTGIGDNNVTNNSDLGENNVNTDSGNNNNNSGTIGDDNMDLNIDFGNLSIGDNVNFNINIGTPTQPAADPETDNAPVDNSGSANTGGTNNSNGTGNSNGLDNSNGTDATNGINNFGEAYGYEDGDVILVHAFDANLGDTLALAAGDKSNRHYHDHMNTDKSNDEYYQQIVAGLTDEELKMDISDPIFIDAVNGEIIGDISFEEYRTYAYAERKREGGALKEWADLAEYENTINGATIYQDDRELNVVDSIFRRGLDSPLTLDLKGDGLEFTSLENGAIYDIDGDGSLEQTAWTNNNGEFDDAFLALDRDGNNYIDDGKELFGDQHGAADGYKELAKYDSDGNNVIDANDEIYSDLKLWADMNQDGISQSGELKTLEEAGIAAISLDTTGQKGEILDANGNDISIGSTFTKSNGETGETTDVFFQNNDLVNEEAIRSEISTLEADLDAAKVDGDDDEANYIQLKIDELESSLIFD